MNLSAPAIRTYAYLLEKFTPGESIIIDMQMREDIRVAIKSKSVSTINNILLPLVKNNLLHRDKFKQGVYYINPHIAFKGDINTRAFYLRKYDSKRK